MEEIEKIKQDLHLVKKEVDALQITIMSSRTPWYKSIPTIISVLALAFSFGTTYVSNERTKVQDTMSLKSDLRNMLQRLSDIPSKNFELTRKYADDPQAIAFFGGQLNQENSLLAVQAAELSLKLPPDKVTAIELYSIAVALQFSYQNEKAKKFFQLSFDEAEDLKDMNTAVSAKRGIANLDFIDGHPEAGRVQFQEALGIFTKNKGYNISTQNSTHILTLLNWAGAEASIGSFDLAKQKLEEAESIVRSMVSSPLTNQLAGQISQTRMQLLGVTNQSSRMQ